MSRDREEFIALVDEHGGPAVGYASPAVWKQSRRRRHVSGDCGSRVGATSAAGPGPRSPRAWLITIGYRAFLDERKRMRRGATDRPDDFVDYRIGSAEGRLEQAEANARLNEQIGELPVEVRQVVTLHYMGGLSIRQTATAMGATVATTKNRLHTALERLRSVLE